MANTSSEAQVVRQGEALGVLVRHVSSVYPSPEVIDGFERHFKGAAKEILDMAKEEQRHIHALENGANRRLTIGMISGVILCAIFIAAGTFLVYTDHPVGGGASILLGLLMILNNLVTGAKQNLSRE